MVAMQEVLRITEMRTTPLRSLDISGKLSPVRASTFHPKVGICIGGAGFCVLQKRKFKPGKGMV